jgi:hypothetical protein
MLGQVYGVQPERNGIVAERLVSLLLRFLSRFGGDRVTGAGEKTLPTMERGCGDSSIRVSQGDA